MSTVCVRPQGGRGGPAHVDAEGRGSKTDFFVDVIPIDGFRKFDHISKYMRDVLHWLPFPQHISYRIASLLRRCLSGWAPCYLLELCRPLSSCAGRRTLRSSALGNLVVPFARSATMQTHSFSVVGPKAWNGLPVDLMHLPNSVCSQFHHLLNTVLFRLAWVGRASE